MLFLHPGREITYPDGSQAPILTKDEFTVGIPNELDYKQYRYSRASIIDYKATINEGVPLLDLCWDYVKEEYE